MDVWDFISQLCCRATKFRKSDCHLKTQILKNLARSLLPLALKYSLRGEDDPCLILRAVFWNHNVICSLTEAAESLSGWQHYSSVRSPVLLD